MYSHLVVRGGNQATSVCSHLVVRGGNQATSVCSQLVVRGGNLFSCCCCVHKLTHSAGSHTYLGVPIH